MDVTQEEWRELWELVREAQKDNAIQNTNINNLCDRIATQVEVTDRFFEELDKRDEESARRFDELVKDHKAHEEHFWKIVTVLLGALIALALGPKAIDKFKDSIGAQGTHPLAFLVAPYYDNRNSTIRKGDA